jgi:two-component system nitrate/nitrite response regulator NarL
MSANGTPPMTRPMMVLVADDHPVYRQGVVRSLKSRPGLRVEWEAGSGREALRVIRDERPDIAVLDLRMPELDGLQVLEEVEAQGLATRVVLLSGHTSGDTVYRAVAMGALGVLSKDAMPDEIGDAVAAVARGETVLHPDAQLALAAAVRRREDTSRPQLTEREQQVLALLAEGRSAPEIGRTLYLSTATIKSHLHTLYDKLGVSDRAAAVAVAMRTGLLR